jgi:hypothetical protein
MYQTVKLLLNGDRKVSDYYLTAVARWKKIWARPESKDVIKLATLLSDEQTEFELECGFRAPGQEIMVVAGFGMLYTIEGGFEGTADKARLLYDAFQCSFCSIEVKILAREVADFYGLLEEQVA